MMNQFAKGMMLAAIMAIISGCQSEKAGVRESETTFARDALTPYVESGQLPGAINIFYKDGVQETTCIGYSDVAARRPITLDDVFMQCSQTKGFCGVTIAMLIEEGKIGLDDPVSKYLPEFKELWVLKSNENGVKTLVRARTPLTIRMVMNHTGGFPFEICAKRGNIKGGGWSGGAPLRQTAAIAAASPLTAGHDVASIPNPICTRRFRPGDKAAFRRRLGLPADRKLILFVAYKVTSPLKGVGYLCEALRHLAASHPEVRDGWQLVAVGRESGSLAGRVPVPVTAVDYVSTEAEMMDYYRAADVLAMPSLHDNLPNTIAEAMACGMPCVGFDVGGLPQMIDHRQNGYLAAYRDSEDFARGLLDTLHPAHYAERQAAARRKAEHTYSESAVAGAYIDVYEKLLNT